MRDEYRIRHPILDVVGIGLFPHERVSETGRRSDFEEHARQREVVALRRLHLDPIALADARLELDAWGCEASRSPPLRQLERITEGREHDRRSRRNNALQLEREIV